MSRQWLATLDRIDARTAQALRLAGPRALRITMGLVFVWFGAVKFIPGASPAEDLALQTIAALSGAAVPEWFARFALAALETGIGVGFLTGRYLRVAIALLFVQMAGALAPLVVLPHLMFDVFPIKPTMEGQYVIKNLVLISAGLTIGGTVRDGAHRG